MKAAIALSAGLLAVTLALAVEHQDQTAVGEVRPTRDDANSLRGAELPRSHAARENEKNGLRLEAWELPIRDAAGIIPMTETELGRKAVRGKPVLQAGGGVFWLATWSYGAIRIDTVKDEWRIYSKADGLSSNWVGSVFQDSQGNIWLGSAGFDVGLLRPGDPEIIPIPSRTSLGLWPDSFHEDQAGRIWIGSSRLGRGGVVVPGQWEILPIESDGGELGLSWVEDLPWGDVIPRSGGGAYLVGSGGRKAKPLREVLPASFLAEVRSRQSGSADRPADEDATRLRIKDVFADQSNAILWLGLDEGLVHCVGGFESCDFYPHWQPDHGKILSIRGSSNGWLWVLSSHGLYRLRRQEPRPELVTGPDGSEAGFDPALCRFGPGAKTEPLPILSCRTPEGTESLFAIDEQSGQAVVRKLGPIASKPSAWPELVSDRLGLAFVEGELQVKGRDPSPGWKTLGRLVGHLSGQHVRGVIIHRRWFNARWRMRSLIIKFTYEGGGIRFQGMPFIGVLSKETATEIPIYEGSVGKVYAYRPGKRLWGQSGWIPPGLLGLFGYSLDDGQTWHPLQMAEDRDKPEVLAVYDDGADGIWISTAKGLEVCSWQQRSCKPSKLGETIAPLTAIEGSSVEGRPYLGGKDGRVCRVQGDLCELLPPPEGLDSPRKGETRIGAVRAVREYGNSLWIGAENALLHYRQTGDGWRFEAKHSRILSTTETDTIVDLALDTQGRVWLSREHRGRGTQDLSVFYPEDGRLQHFSADILGGDLTLPDAEGAVWVARDKGIGIQRWNPAGVPLRQDLIPFSNYTRWLGRLDLMEADAPGLGGRFKGWLRDLTGNPEDLPTSVWRSRWTGILRSTAGEARAFPIETGYPIQVMEPTRGDGIWAGFAGVGLSRWNKDGERKHWTQADGLPDDTVLDLSTVPGDNGPQRLWIATNDGAALIENDQVKFRVQPEEVPGPVDALVALPDGGALLAFNPIEPALFLSPQESVASSRRSTQLRQVSAEGTIGPPIWLADHEIRDMALDPDGETVWIGTNSGLYRMTDGRLRKATAGGRLGDQSIHRVNTAPNGTLALGIDRQSEKNPAQILIYDPDRQDVRFLTTDDGLQAADRIEMLDFAPDGRLITLAAGRLLRSTGPIAIPPSIPWWKWVLLVAVLLLLGIAAALVFFYHRSRRQLVAQYAGIMTTGKRLFDALGQSARRVDYRTLELPRLPFALPESSQRPVRLHAVLDTEVGVDQIQDVGERLKLGARGPSGDQGSVCAYLLFLRELNPAARFELDNYRLRKQKTIIPIALPFARRALEKGKDGVSRALDELNRRYLAEQDLFDMRNALDEPRFFFGRRALIDEFVEAIGRREHIALIGQRKIGKTSLLNVLGQQLDTFPIATADLQSYSREDDWPPKLFAELLASYDSWGRSRFDERWAPAARDPGRLSGAEFQQAIRERHTLRTRLGVTEPLVVVLDEIERVFPIPKAGGGTLEQVWPYIEAVGALRALGQSAAQRYLCLLVADRSRTFVRLNHFDYPDIEDTNPFYDLFVEKYIQPLSEAECQEMLKDIGHAMGLEVTDGFAAEVYRESGGYPRLARLLASAAYRNRQGSDRLDRQTFLHGLAWLDDEDGSADNFVKENIWEHVSATERAVLAACADDDGVAMEAVEQAQPAASIDADASAAAVPLPMSRRDARHYLLATGLLERTGKQRIRARGALIRRWLSKNA